MKEIDDLTIPDLRFAQDHEWAKLEDGRVRVGISDYAQDQLGDVVYVELPQAGETFEQGAVFGTVESVKAVSELYMPVGGRILAVNEKLEGAPELVNTDPYGDGWMIVVEPADLRQLDALMNSAQYLAVLKG
ncbi:MAG: glycine cleavage system protein GcvH [Desulfobacterales bacterium]|nr:glycine cleavage system protein GcvH [Desulfobacterales bacterium]MDD3081205.1 glycine cleavage system protein GcvH [Desulfobacterales bacterium]MDD3950247.1 glycine cleavage system protein GcvH [Desulfobacterales bacterium]MDD4462869.1 glycine cleavage system protein GcvH [Desulfobacterales bacterium]MDY0378183.1 glycine cleavage system protein GcvH [Desulfobacterales bacterium]